MNGYRKSKGIVIELTALLDVIMIMLFWVMTNVRDSSDDAVDKAEQKTISAEHQLEQMKKENSELQAEIDKLWELAYSSDPKAASNAKALHGYEQGMLINLNIRYDKNGKLYVFNANEELAQAEISNQAEISETVIKAIEKAGLKQDDVILCAMIYDGSSSLYRDVRTVDAAIDNVRNEYKNLYCAYINTAQ